MEDLLSGLNEAQRQAVTETEGFVRIVAGAGSGKTKALTHRYAYLVKTAGIPSSNVLCVTFTNKAAGEMKRRVRRLIGDGYDTSLITTYHGFCVRVLREDISHLFFPESFQILDIGDQKTILEEIYASLDLKLDHASFEAFLAQIGQLKKRTDYVDVMISRDQPDSIANVDPTNTAAFNNYVIKQYLVRQRKIFGLDFDDLINFTFVLFDRFPEVKKKWQEKLFYIQVDEFQDSSKKELRLIDTLSEINRNLFVVGDPDQNIYEWRGADVDILVKFDKTHPGTKTILMTQNYRSTSPILKAANTLIVKNEKRVPKDLFTEKQGGDEILHIHSKTDREGSKFIADEIKKLKESGYALRDIAVLYRATFISRNIEQALMNASIPYEIIGSMKFFDRMEIKDAIAYLRMLEKNDDTAFMRTINTPKRRFGKVKADTLRALAEDSGLSYYETLKINLDLPVFKNSDAQKYVKVIEYLRHIYKDMEISEVLNSILVESDYEKYIRESGGMERFENLSELKRIALEQERAYGEHMSLSQFLQQLALMTTKDSDEVTDSVKLMTIHASKGLEFPVVFISGMSEGVFPSARTLEDRGKDGLEEERRLCFVAVTRAMKKLYLMDAEGETNTGFKLPSRFLFDIGEENYRRIGEISKELIDELSRKTGLKLSRTDIVKTPVGQRVNHLVFGEGTIESITDKGVRMVRFDRTGALRPIAADYDFNAKIDSPSIPDPEPESIAEIIVKAVAELPETEQIVDILEEQLPPPTVEPIIEVPENLSDFNENDVIIIEEDMPEGEDEPQNEFEITEPQEKAKIKVQPPKPLRTGLERNLWEDPNVPKSGWECTGITDLGQPVGICGMCGTQIIRYVHHMRHPNYPHSVGAGCVCAGKMEGDGERAVTREKDYKARQKRLETFLSKTRKQSKNGNIYIKFKEEVVVILKDKNGGFKTVYRNEFSESYPTVEKALEAIFDAVDKNR